MEIDRRAFMATLGGTTAAGLMSDEAKADALEEFMSAQLNEAVGQAAGSRRGDVPVGGRTPGTDRDAAYSTRRGEPVHRPHR